MQKRVLARLDPKSATQVAAGVSPLAIYGLPRHKMQDLGKIESFGKEK